MLTPEELRASGPTATLRGTGRSFTSTKLQMLTSTKVQMLTPEELRASGPTATRRGTGRRNPISIPLRKCVPKCMGCRQAKRDSKAGQVVEVVLSLLALLVQRKCVPKCIGCQAKAGQQGWPGFVVL